MCSKRFLILAVLCPLMLLASCGKKADEANAPTRWGKENYYDKFLWKKHVPDTLYRTIEFDFNQDAKNYMDKPLRLGLFKKTDSGKMLPVRIVSEKGADCHVWGEWTVTDADGKDVPTDHDEFGRLRFKTIAGGSYRLIGR